MKIQGLLLLLSLACAAAEWKTYRCVSRTRITSNEFTSEILTTTVCKKSGKERWLRVTQIKPEKDRSITILKGKTRITYYPGRNATFRANETNTADASALGKLANELQEAGTTPGHCQEMAIPEANGLRTLGAIKISWCCRIQGNVTLDSVALFDSTQTSCGWFLRSQGITAENGKVYDLPGHFSYTNSRTGVSVNTDYSSYRVDEPVPDETFEIANEK